MKKLTDVIISDCSNDRIGFNGRTSLYKTIVKTTGDGSENICIIGAVGLESDLLDDIWNCISYFAQWIDEQITYNESILLLIKSLCEGWLKSIREHTGRVTDIFSIDAFATLITVKKSLDEWIFEYKSHDEKSILFNFVKFSMKDNYSVFDLTGSCECWKMNL